MAVQLIYQKWNPLLQVDIAAYAGLSTDVKPTILSPGSSFHESDTGKDFDSGPTGWVERSAAAGTPDVDIASITAGETHIGETGQWKDLIVITPAIAAALFSANDIVGGKLTLSGAVRVATGKSILDSLALVDASKQNVPLSIFIFGADLAGTYADNAAEAVTAADWLKWLGTIDILAADYKSMANASQVSLGGIGMQVKAAAGTTLYALIVTTGIPTYGANALQLTFGMREGN